MKQMLVVIIGLLLFSGCMIANTPTSKVEEYLSKYQKLDDINIDYVSLANDEDISDEYREEYENLIRNQYKSLSYEIKEEMVDGDNAVVTTQVKVFNYREILDKYDNDSYNDNNKYHELVINDMKKQKDKVVYTIDFELIKSNKDEWRVVGLSYEDSRKLLGIN